VVIPTCSIAPSITRLRSGELLAGSARTSVCCSGGLRELACARLVLAGHDKHQRQSEKGRNRRISLHLLCLDAPFAGDVPVVCG
jgi:hypothetical protein